MIVTSPLGCPYIPHLPEHQNRAGKTELFSAIEQGNAAEVKRVLSLGIDPNCQNESKKTPLEAALELLSTQNLTHLHSIILLLIEHGASYTQPIHKNYLNIFEYAFAKVHYGLLFSLQKYYTIQIPISLQVLNQFFKDCGPQEFALIAKLYPPSLWPHLLIEIEIRAYAQNRAPDSLEELFTKYRSLFAPTDGFIQMPEFLLISPEETEILLQARSYPKVFLQQALSYLALKKGNIACLPVLLRHGADPLLSLNGMFIPPFDIALKEKNSEFLLAVQNTAGVKIPRPSLHEAIVAGDLPRIEKELAHFDPKTEDILGDTALMTAIRHRFLLAVQLLSDTVSFDDLQLAASCSSVEVVSFLATAYKEEIWWDLLLGRACQNNNYQVARWIIEHYAYHDPLNIGCSLLCEHIGTDSFEFLQNFVQKMKLSCDTKHLLGDLFTDAIERRLLPFSSFLLDQIDDLSFFLDDEGVLNRFYNTLFNYPETAFVEKVLKKIGIHNECYATYDTFKALSENHEELFKNLLPELYAQGLSLVKGGSATLYFDGFVLIAAHTGSFEEVKEFCKQLAFDCWARSSYQLALDLLLKRKSPGFSLFLEKAPTVCSVPYAHLTIRQTISWLIDQLFCSICDEEFVHTLLHHMSEIHAPEEYESMLSSLDTKKTSSIPCANTLFPPRVVEPRDSAGKTELFRAVEQGNFSEVKKLLLQGSDPNSLNAVGTSVLESALIHATGTGKGYTLVQLLVGQGALCTRMIVGGYLNVFDYAFSTRNFGLLFVLHSYYKPHIKLSRDALEKFFSTYEACDLEFITRHYPSLELHFGSETICDKFIREGKTRLLKQYAEMAPLAFKKILHQKDSKRSSLLAYALHLDNSEAVEFLRQAGASFDHDPELLTISPEVTKQFLKEGMNSNEQNHEGNSALHLIALENDIEDTDENNHFECLSLLLDHGADFLLPNKEGVSPLELAVNGGSQRFLDQVQKTERFKKIPKPAPHEAVLEAVLANTTFNPADLDLQLRDILGCTALETLIRDHRLEAVQLLAHSANKDTLCVAAKCSSVEIFSFLIHLPTLAPEEPTLNELLHTAITFQNIQVALWILETAIDKYPNNCASLVCSILEYHSTNRIQEIISKEIIIKIKPLLQPNDLQDLFIKALEESQYETLSLLLDHVESPLSFEFLVNNSHIYCLYKYLPERLLQLSDQLLAEGFLLCKERQEKQLIQELIALAIYTGKLSLVQEYFTAFSQVLEPQDVRDFFIIAIDSGHPELSLYFLEKLQVIDEALLLLAIQKGNEQVLHTIFQKYTKEQKEPDFTNIYKQILLGPENTLHETLIRILRLHRRDLALPDQEALASLLIHVMKFPSGLQAVLLGMSKEEAEGLRKLVDRLPHICKIPCGNLSLHHSVDWLIEQIFAHSKKMNPDLFCDRAIYDTFLELVSLISRIEEYGALLVAFQVAPNKESVTHAFLAAKRLEGGVIKPSKEQLFQRSEEEQKQWLAFALVYRDRAFLPHCCHIIKQYDTHLPLLIDALHAIRKIGIKRYNSELENSLATAIHNILQKCHNEEIKAEEMIKIAALHAYIGTNHLSHNPELLDFLLSLLCEARKTKSTDFEMALTLHIGTSYEWTHDCECDKAVHHLTAGLQSENEDVRYTIALALTSIPQKDGLLAALEVVQSTTWDRQLCHFGKDREAVTGSFLMFRSRPFQIHDNRNAMHTRILKQLIRLHEKDPHFCTLVEQYPNLESVRTRVEAQFSIIASTARYVPLPIVYPPHTDLIRGLSTRKGKRMFRESVRDVLRKGAGSSQLTDHDAAVGGNTWNKIGHMFASHNKDLHFSRKTGSIYFSADNDGVVTESALIVFPAAYYEKEYLAGQARLEREGTLNNVLYRGIPHRWIKAIYLPERFKADIELLSGNTPLESALKALTSDLFTGDTIKELEAIRRQLLAKEMDLTQENPKLVAFKDKLRYFPQVEATKVGEILVGDGISFATEEDIKKETVKSLIKNQVLINKLYKNPWQFRTQDQWLRHATDQEFKENAELFYKMLPKSMRPSKLECPETDHNIKLRAPLRVASLLCSAGKQVEDIINPMFYGLTKEELPLVASLFRHLA